MSEFVQNSEEKIDNQKQELIDYFPQLGLASTIQEGSHVFKEEIISRNSSNT